MLHFTPELAVGDLLVPFEKDLADFDFFAPVYVEMQDDLAVFVLLAARGDLREQVAFFFQIIPDDLLGTLNVGRAHPAPRNSGSRLRSSFWSPFFRPEKV